MGFLPFASGFLLFASGPQFYLNPSLKKTIMKNVWGRCNFLKKWITVSHKYSELRHLVAEQIPLTLTTGSATHCWPGANIYSRNNVSSNFRPNMCFLYLNIVLLGFLAILHWNIFCRPWNVEYLMFRFSSMYK